MLYSFLAGCHAAFARVLLLALTTNVTIFAALCVCVTPRTIVDKNGFLLIHCLDHYAMVTAKALALHSSAQSSPRSIVVLGTSTTVLCVTSEQGLAELVREESGMSTVAHNMCTDAQSTWEMAALVNYLPPHFSGVIVFGMTPGLLSHGISEGTGVDQYSLTEVLNSPRLGFVSHALDAEAQLAGLHVPFRTGIYVWDSRNFYLSRRRAILRNLLSGPLAYGDPIDAAWMPTLNREKSWHKAVAELPSLIGRYNEYSQLNPSSDGLSWASGHRAECHSSSWHPLSIRLGIRGPPEPRFLGDTRKISGALHRETRYRFLTSPRNPSSARRTSSTLGDISTTVRPENDARKCWHLAWRIF